VGIGPIRRDVEWMVGGECGEDGCIDRGGPAAPDGGEDDAVDPLGTPRRREALRVLAGRRLLSALYVDPDEEAPTDGGDGEADDATMEPGAPGPAVVDVDTLVGEVVARERAIPGRGSGDADHHRQVRETLVSDHLPALDTADVVAYDPDAGTVTYDGDPGIEARLHLR